MRHTLKWLCRRPPGFASGPLELCARLPSPLELARGLLLEEPPLPPSALPSWQPAQEGAAQPGLRRLPALHLHLGV